jgi:hypothetical protein
MGLLARLFGLRPALLQPSSSLGEQYYGPFGAAAGRGEYKLCHKLRYRRLGATIAAGSCPEGQLFRHGTGSSPSCGRDGRRMNEGVRELQYYAEHRDRPTARWWPTRWLSSGEKRNANQNGSIRG